MGTGHRFADRLVSSLWGQNFNWRSSNEGCKDRPRGVRCLGTCAYGLLKLEQQRIVIISRTSGVGEILTNVLKCDFWDVDDMANKIVAVLRHPPLQRTLRDSGYLEVRGITWDGAAAKVDAVYERAMAAVNRR